MIIHCWQGCEKVGLHLYTVSGNVIGVAFLESYLAKYMKI